MEQLTHAQNFNQKLLCDYFPDVRLYFLNRFSVGDVYEHHLAGLGFIGYAKVVYNRVFEFKYMTDALAYQIMGQPKHVFVKMLQDFYDHKLTPETKMVQLIWKFTERHPETLLPLFEKPWNKMLSQTPRSSMYNDGPHLTT